MDAVKFLKEKARMCAFYPQCSECPMKNLKADCAFCSSKIDVNPEQSVEMVEKWSREHPIITNADKAKEIFGIVNLQGCVGIKCHAITCINCEHREFWQREYKELTDYDRDVLGKS